MANTALTADVVAKEALVMLENELGVLGTFHRAHEDEFASEVNGFKKGATIRIRRPADFTVRSGATMDLQDAIEGRTTFLGTVELLWPEADEQDAKKLEKFLTNMKTRAH